MVIPNHSYVKDGIRYLKIKVDIMLSGGGGSTLPCGGMHLWKQTSRKADTTSASQIYRQR